MNKHSNDDASRRVRVRYDFSNGGPKARSKAIRQATLRLANRLRQIRTLDVAAGLFPERKFKAALSAAQRCVGKLVKDRMLIRYRSLSGQTYYGLTQRGVTYLKTADETLAEDTNATASASRVCEKTNPEHALWGGFVVLCCEARGLVAETEVEMKPYFFAGRISGKEGKKQPKRHYPAAYHNFATDKKKGLMPDVLAYAPDRTVTWFEIDRSARGQDRMQDLVGLVSMLGRQIMCGDGKERGLNSIVFLCKTRTILRRNRSYLLGSSPDGLPHVRINRIGRDSGVKQVNENVFDIFGEVSYTLPDGRSGIRVTTVGRVYLQLLPTHLSRYSYRDGEPSGWFDDGSLPYARLESWVAPIPSLELKSLQPGSYKV